MTALGPWCIAGPHHLATDIGAAVLRDGGNAVDAAIATNLALSVVTPYHCGPGGDLFALIWDGELHAYRSAGRAPAAATPAAVAAAADSDTMPVTGALTVTVPGAVHGWFALLGRFGTRPFGELAAPAVALARDGFEPSAHAAPYLDGTREYAAASWHAVYGDAAPGRPLRQPDLARTLETLASDGPDALYRGSIGADLVAHVQELGGLLTVEDLAAHADAWPAPLRAPFRDLEVAEHPPPTQGVTALEALRIVDGLALPDDPVPRTHLLIEAMKVALDTRAELVADPDRMPVPASALIDERRIAARRDLVRPDRATPLTRGTVELAGTAYLCAADRDGLLVSLIQSNYGGFGSGLTVPGRGINLHNRGASFTFDPDAVDVVAPRALPRHTVIPAMAFRDGRPHLVFGTMGGDGQAQVHLQLLDRLTTGSGVEAALDAPRWIASPVDGSVDLEDRSDPALAAGLRALGHEVRVTGAYEDQMGHAHLIAVDGDGYRGATDPRTEGAVLSA